MIGKLKKLPGRTVRRELVGSARLPLAVVVRAAFRFSVAVTLYFIGLAHIAQIVAVMTVMMLFTSVEGQAAKVVADAIPRAGAYFKKHWGRGD